jgi:hypothetical protein
MKILNAYKDTNYPMGEELTGFVIISVEPEETIDFQHSQVIIKGHSRVIRISDYCRVHYDYPSSFNPTDNRWTFVFALNYGPNPSVASTVYTALEQMYKRDCSSGDKEAPPTTGEDVSLAADDEPIPRAVVRISFELLAEMTLDKMGYKGARIAMVKGNSDAPTRQFVEVVFEHPDCPRTIEGGDLPIIEQEI